MFKLLLKQRKIVLGYFPHNMKANAEIFMD